MELKCKIDKTTTVRQALKLSFDLSNRILTKLKKENKIFCNEKLVNIHETLKKGDILKVFIDFEEESENIVPVKMDLNILYEDEGMLVIDKPPHMPVHPSINHYEDSLSNGVKYYFNSLGLKRKIRPVNRLDKDTSGIVIFAKNEYIQEALIKQMKTNEFEKEYLALLEGVPTKSHIEIVAPIARESDSIITRCVSNSGAYAKTIVDIIDRFESFTLVKCTLKTGRTHQIRVHTKYISHPIIGDTLYGNRSDLINRQALHAYRVIFTHPVTKQKINITCELPKDMKQLICKK